MAHLLAGEDERAEGDGVGPEAGFQQLLVRAHGQLPLAAAVVHSDQGAERDHVGHLTNGSQFRVLSVKVLGFRILGFRVLGGSGLRFWF